MEVEFREATEADSASIAALLRILGYPIDSRGVQARLGSLDGDLHESIIVAVLNGKVVAFATLVYIPFFHLGHRLCRVSAIAVDAPYQGKGVGRKLMGEIERIARDEGCAGIEVTSSRERIEAHRFYVSLGYKQSSLKFRKWLNDARLSAGHHSA